MSIGDKFDKELLKPQFKPIWKLWESLKKASLFLFIIMLHISLDVLEIFWSSYVHCNNRISAQTT
jgi:hypothetical protein